MASQPSGIRRLFSYESVIATQPGTGAAVESVWRVSPGKIISAGLGAMAALGVIWVSAERPAVLAFLPTTGAQVVDLLLPLFLIALFIERAVEVFVTAWRAPRESVLKAEVKAGNLPPRQLGSYKTQTKQVAFLVALVFGITTAAMGFRIIAQLIDPAALAAGTGIQRGVFVLIDTLLTAGLLAGGAEGLHRIIMIFLDGADKTRAKL